MLVFYRIFLTFFLIGARAAAEGGHDLASILSNQSLGRWSSSTVISYPGNASFTNATERWDGFKSPTFNVSISPGTEDDVIMAASDFHLSRMLLDPLN